MATSRTLSLVSAVEKSRLESTTPYLLLLDITPINRFTGVEGDHIRILHSPASAPSEDETAGGYTFRGNVFAPAAFDVQLSESANEVPDLQLNIDDITGLVRNQMDQFQGGVGFNVTVLIVMGGSTDVADLEENFLITASNVQDRQVSFTLGAPSMLATQFPRRRQLKTYCEWQYKSAECKYAGVLATCDRTLNGTNGCAFHGNTINFGGFPGIQATDSVR